MAPTDFAKDRAASDLILVFLEEKGLSPEQFSRAAFNKGCGYVSGKTIRRIVETGVVPKTLRVRGTIALYMERSPRSIWRNAPVVAGRKVSNRRVAI